MLASYDCGKNVIVERSANRVNLVANVYVKLDDTRTYYQLNHVVEILYTVTDKKEPKQQEQTDKFMSSWVVSTHVTSLHQLIVVID